MNFGWGRAALIAAVMLAGCGQAQPMDPNAGKAEAAAFMAKTAKDYFIAMTEFHFMNPQTMSEIAYYPNVQRWWGSVDGVMRAWSGRDLTGEWPHPHRSHLRWGRPCSGPGG